jgi:hypothetical protein
MEEGMDPKTNERERGSIKLFHKNKKGKKKS